MIVKRYKNGLVKIHIEDSDQYMLTEDNGVDLWLSSVGVKKLKEEL
jgi:hypothetical protein